MESGTGIVVTETNSNHGSKSEEGAIRKAGASALGVTPKEVATAHVKQRILSCKMKDEQ